MPLPARFHQQLALPVISAPMFLVSGPDLVIAACRAGIVGAFPSLNARSSEILDDWLSRIGGELAAAREAEPNRPIGPHAVNLIVHRSTRRLAEDTEALVRHQVPLVITSIGNPAAIAEAVHGYGGAVFHDVTTLRHARKAAAAGVDGLILVCAGAGGHAGTMSPFAMVPQVREFFDGTIVLAGAISDGRGVRAAEVLGADMAYMGTRFIATSESMAQDDYKRMLVESEAADILYTPAFSGIPANMLRPSIAAAGLDPDRLPEHKEIDLGAELNAEAKAWKTIWSAGQGVGSIADVLPVAELVERLRREYRAAGRALAAKDAA